MSKKKIKNCSKVKKATKTTKSAGDHESQKTSYNFSFEVLTNKTLMGNEAFSA